MKYIKQFVVICIVSFIGELFNYYLPFPIPGNIYGMILMLTLLLVGGIKIQQINDVSKFLLDIMPVLFIPSAVGIMTKFKELIDVWWQIFILTIVTTIIVMVVSGRVTQRIIRHDNECNKNSSEKMYKNKKNSNGKG